MARRALHYVFRLCDRANTIRFYTDILGMQVLRHEEFSEGCEATCNGPYAGRWSKTMIGYGPEDTNFALELTFNYGIEEYELGNNFINVTLKSEGCVMERLLRNHIPHNILDDGSISVSVPSSPGYKFHIVKGTCDAPTLKIVLGSSNLQKTVDFYGGTLGMHLLEKDTRHAILQYSGSPCTIEFRDIGELIKHKSADGRIAFSCPSSDLLSVQEAVQASGCKVKTPLLSLETPGKATVQVVIVLDPDMHEICFVGDEAFRELSQVDPNATELLQQGIEEEKRLEKTALSWKVTGH